MTDKKDYALKLALGALEIVWKDHPAITAIRSALAEESSGTEQPEQHTEPCGWRMKYNGGWAYSFTKDAWDFIYAVSPAARKAARGNAPASKPFDTHAAPGQSFDTHSRTPQPSKPLTDEMDRQAAQIEDYSQRNLFITGWLHAEAAHGIKGDA